jgi:hypothetical protein
VRDQGYLAATARIRKNGKIRLPECTTCDWSETIRWDERTCGKRA